MSVDEALDLVAERVPSLAASALRAKSRPAGSLRDRQARRLAEAAAMGDGPTDEERRGLREFAAAPADDRRTAILPPIRVTPAQLEELTREADGLGLKLSDLVRRRIFREDSSRTE